MRNDTMACGGGERSRGRGGVSRGAGESEEVGFEEGCCSHAPAACAAARGGGRCRGDGLMMASNAVHVRDDMSTSSTRGEPAWVPRPLCEDGLRRRSACGHPMPDLESSRRAPKMARKALALRCPLRVLQEDKTHSGLGWAKLKRVASGREHGLASAAALPERCASPQALLDYGGTACRRKRGHRGRHHVTAASHANHMASSHANPTESSSCSTHCARRRCVRAIPDSNPTSSDSPAPRDTPPRPLLLSPTPHAMVSVPCSWLLLLLLHRVGRRRRR